MSADDDPAYGQLQDGFTEEHLEEAIARSGYPFQAAVAEAIEQRTPESVQDLQIQEEWAFVDRESGKSRSTDLLVTALLRSDWDKPTLASSLGLLVECKQSRDPY